MAVTDQRTDTQLAALATLLDTEVAEFASLGRLGAEYVHDLRLAISDNLFDHQAPHFARVSRLAPLAPNALIAKVVPHMVPPMVAGKAAGALGVDHPDRIEDLLGRLPPQYMADSSPHVDPRTIKQVARNMSAEAIIPVARILLSDGDYVTAANFVEFATEELVAELCRSLDDDSGLLTVGALIYSDEVLDRVVRSIPADRYARLLRSMLTDDQSVAAGMSVVARVGPDTKAALIGAVAPELDQFSEGALRDLIGRSEDPSVVAVARELLDEASAVRASA